MLVYIRILLDIIVITYTVEERHREWYVIVSVSNRYDV